MNLLALNVRDGNEGLRQKDRDVMKPMEDIPDLTNEQMKLLRCHPSVILVAPMLGNP